MSARILVVDDSPTIRKVVGSILEARAYEPVLAGDGQEALELLETEKVDLVLLDFVMPRMNGYQFCRELRAHPELKGLPVVLMSAKGDKIRGQFVQQTGAIDAETENRTAAAFLITATLESQRHPELSRPGVDSVATTRAFLLRAINDGIQRGDVDADTDAAALTEMLLAVLLGVGFYAGFIGSRHELDPVTDQLKLLLARSLTRRTD